jgi:glutaminyl-peptide cyclotransferase
MRCSIGPSSFLRMNQASRLESRTRTSTTTRRTRTAIAFWLVLFAAFGTTGCKPKAAESEEVSRKNSQSTPLPPRREKLWLDIDGNRALTEAHTLARFGPRQSGSDANAQTQKHLTDTLVELGWEPVAQAFTDNAPDGRRIQFSNIIARYSHFPKATKRFIIAAHFDTLATNEFPAIGASDGAANTAVLIELARVLALDPQVAGQVELLFLDGSAPFRQTTISDGLFGSRFYTQMVGINQQTGDIRAAIILQNVGTDGARLMFSQNSDPKLAAQMGNAAKLLGYRLDPSNRPFLADHVPFQQAGVPAMAFLDANSQLLNTADDTSERLNPTALAKLGSLITCFLAQSTNDN